MFYSVCFNYFCSFSSSEKKQPPMPVSKQCLCLLAPLCLIPRPTGNVFLKTNCQRNPTSATD